MSKKKINHLTTTYQHCPSKSEKHVFIYINEDKEREKKKDRSQG